MCNRECFDFNPRLEGDRLPFLNNLYVEWVEVWILFMTLQNKERREVLCVNWWVAESFCTRDHTVTHEIRVSNGLHVEWTNVCCDALHERRRGGRATLTRLRTNTLARLFRVHKANRATRRCSSAVFFAWCK